MVYGNAFLGSAVSSVGGNLANGTATGTVADAINNIERLKIPNPSNGVGVNGGWGAAPWIFSVRGTAVPLPPAPGGQRYSLVVTGPNLVLTDGGTATTGPVCSAPPP